MIYTIYKLTDDASGLIYVGQTTNLRHRLAAHRCKIFEGRTFQVEILARTTSSARADLLERDWIVQLDATNELVGLNSMAYRTEPNDRTRKRMSESQLARSAREPNPFLGRKHSEETKAKMRGVKKPGPRPHFQKPVRNLDTGETFPSLDAAAKAYGLHKAAVSRVCLGKAHTSGGFRWAYA